MSYKIELPYNIGEKFYSNRVGIACEHEILKINIEITIGNPMEVLYVTRGDTLIFMSNAMFKTREDAVANLVKNIDGLDCKEVIRKLSSICTFKELPIVDTLDYTSINIGCKVTQIDQSLSRDIFTVKNLIFENGKYVMTFDECDDSRFYMNKFKKVIEHHPV